MSKLKTASGLALLALAATLGSASAEPWANYESAFPTFPCQDGWVGCVQDGRVLDPDLQADGTGMLNPADARIGWFDLEATSNFNPFPSLSKYTGEQPRRKSDAPEPAPNTDGVASTDGDGTQAGTAPGSGTDGDSNGGADGGGDDDGVVAATQPVVSDEGREAEEEAKRKRLEEAEARKKAEQAEEERQRAEQEAKARTKAADDKAAQAQRALKLAQEAQGEAEKKRLMEDARRAQEAEELARKQADEAQKMRLQREAEAKQREAEEAKARAASEKAEADRKKQEEADRKAAEKKRQEDEARKAAAEADAQKAAAEARRKVEEQAARDAAAAEKRARELAEQAKAAATQAEKDRLQKEAAQAAAASKQAEEDAKRNADAAAEKARLEEQKKAKEAEEQRKAKEAEEKAAADKAKAAAAGTTEQTSTSAMVQEGCDDLVTLETVAILGKLDATTNQCLEGKLAAASRMTEKSKISRTLMINAFAAGRTNDWADLMKRHLTEIEQSDPELCYKYALHLSKMGPVSAYGVIKWANVALENRTIWTGSTYISRVYSLYKIRATSAEKIWVDLENKHAANPSEESSQQTKTARDRTKEYAREWYEYAKVSGKPTEKALDLCMSSAGTKDYCEAG